MFKKLLKSKIGQATAEYATLIALVVAAVIAMQTYAQRAIQARIRDASLYMANQTATLGTTNQYEAYYSESQYNIDRTTTDTNIHNSNTVSYGMDETRTRRSGGATNTTTTGMINGI